MKHMYKTLRSDCTLLYSVQTLLDNETKSLPMLSYNKQVNEINLTCPDIIIFYGKNEKNVLTNYNELMK